MVRGVLLISWPAIATVRGWLSKRKALLTGLVGVAVEEVVDLVPGGELALRLVGEVAKHGVERLADPKADVPEVKPAGQALPPAQLDEINAWLETLTTSAAKPAREVRGRSPWAIPFLCQR